MTTFTEDKQAAENAASIEKSTAVYRKWLAAKHPEIHDTKGLLKQFQEYMDFTAELNQDDFEFALQHMPDTAVYNKQHVPTKAELIDDICDLLSEKGGPYSAFNVKSIRTKMQSWSLEALKARKDEIIRVRTLNQLPVSELKQMVHDAYQPQSGFPKLPRTTMDGRVIDTAFLRRMPLWEFKKFKLLYGDSAINARLAGE